VQAIRAYGEVEILLHPFLAWVTSFISRSCKFQGRLTTAKKKPFLIIGVHDRQEKFGPTLVGYFIVGIILMRFRKIAKSDY
jgi:hypothetical protein